MRLRSFSLWRVPDGSSEVELSSMVLWPVPDDSSEVRLSPLKLWPPMRNAAVRWDRVPWHYGLYRM